MMLSCRQAVIKYNRSSMKRTLMTTATTTATSQRKIIQQDPLLPKKYPLLHVRKQDREQQQVRQISSILPRQFQKRHPRNNAPTVPAALIGNSTFTMTMANTNTFTFKAVNVIHDTITAKRWHGGPNIPDDAPSVTLNFLQPDGTTIVTVQGKVGESFLQTAHRNDIDLEGACEGVCACSTCHLIFPLNIFDTLDEASEDEEDMLDMAFGLTETSRLGCQVIITKEMDNMTVEMPKATRNFYVDGHVPKPH